MSKINLGVIGLGHIFNEHYKVILKIKEFNISGVFTKTNKNSFKFARKNKSVKVYKTIDEMMRDNHIQAVIVLVSPDESFNVIKKIIPYRKIFFTEKPVGLNFKQAKELLRLANKYKTLNMVGYNRRFYSVFEKGIEHIKKKGELYGILIEGHERFWKIKKRKTGKLLYNWIYANSTHTIDLLRYFGGEFDKIFSIKNSIYNINGDQFSMILKSKKKIIATYVSNWYSPGGWSVKLFGDRISAVFDPLEKGYLIDHRFNKTIIQPSKNDTEFKPGFYKQLIFFKKLILDKKLHWPAQDIKETFETVKITKKILS